jgi:hypothetical protein
MSNPRLQLKNVGQIHDADIEFGDLTVLVGPQRKEWGQIFILDFRRKEWGQIFILDFRRLEAISGESALLR